MFLPLKEIFANQVFRDFSPELIFANEKIQLFFGDFRNEGKISIDFLISFMLL